MPNEETWKTLLSQQRAITEELEKEISKLKAEDIVVENGALRNELTKCKELLTEADQQVAKLTDENNKLKNSLYEQIYNEKIAILNAVSRKTEVYYQNSMSGEMNRLKAFEMESIHRINYMMNILVQNRVNSQDEIYFRLNELRQLLDYKMSEARRIYAEQSGAYEQNRAEQYRRLREEGISEEEMKRALKKNNIESLIGLNIINKIGILLLIIGAIALTQFTYLRLPDIMKSIFVFLGGAVLLVLGELLNRKKPNVFSLGLTSGGVAVLYVAITVSYFGLKNISMYLALLLCVVITALSFYLSQRYQSQTIAAFALVGGYLPILSIASNETLVYSAMVYFIILNLLSLMIAFRKKWFIATYIGFAFNVCGTAYIMHLALDLFRTELDTITVADFITILYILLAFLIYTLIPIAGTYFDKKKMSTADVVLLGLNTYISAIFLYIAFDLTAFADFKGVLAVLFAVTYNLLAKFMAKKLSEEKKIRALFSITSFAFVVLIIPFQFDIIWLSLGWLVEGVLLITYGILKEDKKFRRYGYIVSSLCLAAFYLLDVLPEFLGKDHYFTYKYLFVTLGSLIIIASYIYKKTFVSKTINILKYFTYINLWFFLIYMIWEELFSLIHPLIKNNSINEGYLLHILCITCGFLLAYMIPKIRRLYDWGMKLISMAIYGLSILWLLLIDTVSSPVVSGDITLGATILGSAILIIINLLSVLAMMDLIRGLVLDRKLSTEWYPLILSIYFVVILTQNLITQYELEFTNFTISIIYILLAFSWIVFGFVKKYSFLRRFGLGLSFLAIAKLFLLDLSILTEGYRIISYFAFGIVLVAISFVYQYFSKRLEENHPHES
jgi:hypothetical protein